MLDPRIGAGDFLLNLSVDVSSTALIELCRKRARSISTPVSSHGPAAIPIRACHPPRDRIMRCAKARWRCAGAVPQRSDRGRDTRRQSGPGLALRQAGARSISPAMRHRSRSPQIATIGRVSRSGSASRSFISPNATPRSRTSPRSRASSSIPGRSRASSAKARSRQNSAGARMNGTFRSDGRRHDFGSGAAIYLLRPGAATRVRSWTPLEGPYHGFLITHGESISIADFLTSREGNEGALPADLPLRLSPVRRRGAEPARICRQKLAAAARANG